MKRAFVENKFLKLATTRQNNWRETKNYPIGTYMKNKKILESPSNIEVEYAHEKGVNFLTQNILNVAENAVKNREKGALMQPHGLYTNLLSTQTLAFNLFGEMSLNLQLATAFFSYFFPGKINKVTKVIFEHSDGRYNEDYTNDYLAFDVFIEYKTEKGKNGFIGIDVKYTRKIAEHQVEDTNNKFKDGMERFGIFKSDSYYSLNNSDLQPIWRSHLLSLAHLKHKNKKYKEGMYVFLFPSENEVYKSEINSYIQHLKSYNGNDNSYNKDLSGFYPFYLEDFINKLQDLCDEPWTRELSIRYLGKD